jgi:hypothetical protein
LPYI